jgi:CheY-like chemotaxis protein
MDKILIIDDEKAVLDTLSMALAELPFEIISTDDPQTGTQLFSWHNPFLVILDMNMGDISGIDFIQYLIQNEVPNHMIKDISADSLNESESNPLSLKDADFFVLVLTGYGNKEIMQQCASLGVEHFLNKPVHLATLRNVVESIHSLKTKRDELLEFSEGSKLT